MDVLEPVARVQDALDVIVAGGCEAAVSPVGSKKRVSFMPSARALAFIAAMQASMSRRMVLPTTSSTVSASRPARVEMARPSKVISAV